MKNKLIRFESCGSLKLLDRLCKFPFFGKIEADEVVKLSVGVQMNFFQGILCLLIEANGPLLPYPFLLIIFPVTGMVLYRLADLPIRNLVLEKYSQLPVGP